MHTNYASASPVSTLGASQPKVRGIEDILSEIGAELSDAANSASNLADKIVGAEPVGNDAAPAAPNCLQNRLEAILGGIRTVNYHLNRSHRALNG